MIKFEVRKLEMGGSKPWLEVLDLGLLRLS